MSSPGRLILVKQRKMEKTLQEYFVKGYSESGTASITGIGINTVSKYFGKWHKELLEQDNNEFWRGLEDSRNRVRLVHDFQLKELYKIQEDMNQEFNDYKLKNNGKIPHGKGMYKEREKIAVAICNMIYASGVVFATRKEAEITEVAKKEVEIKYNRLEEQRKNGL